MKTNTTAYDWRQWTSLTLSMYGICLFIAGSIFLGINAKDSVDTILAVVYGAGAGLFFLSKLFDVAYGIDPPSPRSR